MRATAAACMSRLQEEREARVWQNVRYHIIGSRSGLNGQRKQIPKWIYISSINLEQRRYVNFLYAYKYITKAVNIIDADNIKIIIIK